MNFERKVMQIFMELPVRCASARFPFNRYTTEEYAYEPTPHTQHRRKSIKLFCGVVWVDDEHREKRTSSGALVCVCVRVFTLASGICASWPQRLDWRSVRVSIIFVYFWCA